MKLDSQLIKLFSAVVPAGEELISPVEVNLAAMPCGYYVVPEACTASTLSFLREQAVNYNSTFYASRSDVAAQSRIELLVDQLIHYASTYGTDFSGPTYTRNPDPAVMAFKELTTLRAVSAEEMDRMCMDLLKSGAAIKSACIPALAQYVFDFRGAHMSVEEIDAVTNREARIVLYSLSGQAPSTAQDIMRLMVYKATGSFLLIKSRAILNGILTDEHQVHSFFAAMPEEAVRELATAFYRYEAYLFNFKRNWRHREKDIPECKLAATRVNYIRRLARKLFRPLHPGVLDRVASPQNSPEDLRAAAAKEKNIFRLLRILGYIRMHLSAPGDIRTNLYIIRDGRMWVSVNPPRPEAEEKDSTTLLNAAVIIWQEIVERLRKRGLEGMRICFPKDLQLAAPTSHKNFVGPIPVWSSIALEDNSFIGIYWRNEWGTRDFDLSVTTDSGIRLGWNSSYYNPDRSIVYSGDMTDANPEAAEILYCEKSCPEAVFYVNRYFGEDGSLFRLFYGLGKPENPAENTPEGNYIPGQNFSISVMNVRVEADVTSTMKEQLVGYTHSDRFYFVALSSSDDRVSSAFRGINLMDAIRHRTYSAIDLRSLLLDAGAIEVDADDNPDIDLSTRNLNQALIINLFQ